LVAPLAWFWFRQLEVLHSSDSTRVAILSSLLLCFQVLTRIEFWRSNTNLPSRWPLIGVTGMQAAVLFSRMFRPFWMLHALTGRSPSILVIALIYFMLLSHTIFAAFLLAFLMKERREQHYKRAALVDPLTGIWNRRGFLAYASQCLSRAAVDKQAVALIAFDLDHFKFINDTHGHLAGDRMLSSFCNVVTKALRPGDLFGRIGGEEFACLLVDVSAADAVSTAERLRCRFADSESSRLRATVSAGVAAASSRHRIWRLSCCRPIGHSIGRRHSAGVRWSSRKQ
jgi:diguanylate cyclase (GGDEF)-like protein